MRCEVLKCRENENGYCMIDNYVTITADGECDSISIPMTDSERGADDGRSED